MSNPLPGPGQADRGLTVADDSGGPVRRPGTVLPTHESAGGEPDGADRGGEVGPDRGGTGRGDAGHGRASPMSARRAART